jgi:HEAT repeat protein
VSVFDLFKKKDASADASVLERIASLGRSRDLRVIPELLVYLPPAASIYGEAAADAVHALIESASPEAIAQFDAWYRARTWQGPPSPSWANMRVGPLEPWAKGYPATVGLATCHRSGFVREKAVETLARCETGLELPFLLVRLNDWVPEVRFVAAKGARLRLTAAYASHWVRCLALLERLRLGSRSDHGWLRGPVDALLQRDECRAALEAGLLSGSVGVRRACLRVAAGLADPTELVRRALGDPDPLTSGRAADLLCRTLEGDALRKVLAVMRRGNARARGLALTSHCAGFPEDAEEVLRAALLDGAASVRELARFEWRKKEPALDFASFYRSAIDRRTGDEEVAALRGLAETGTVQDVPLFLKYAENQRARLREAAVFGLGRCDGENHRELLVKSLSDTNLGVVKTARRYARLYLGRGAVPKRAPRAKKEVEVDDSPPPWLRGPK